VNISVQTCIFGYIHFAGIQHQTFRGDFPSPAVVYTFFLAGTIN
jgi:hypothetical protein